MKPRNLESHVPTFERFDVSKAPRKTAEVREQIWLEERRLDAAESRMQRRARLAHKRSAGWALALAAAAFGAGGCFSERSFVVPEAQLFPAAQVAGAAGHSTTQNFVDHAAPPMTRNLPADRRVVLTGAAARNADGNPVDVWNVFGIDPAALDKLLGNLPGLQATANVSPPGKIDAVAERWPGFACVEIPMPDGLRIYARIAPPLDPNANGSYIVLTHGLFAAQRGCDARNLADALRRYGHHVVAIEMRGHGETGRLNPRYPTTFGASEVRDLIEVARWLRDTRAAKRVGLLSFSITAQEAMTAAWVDGDGGLADELPSPVFSNLPRPRPQPAYDAIVAVCPPINLVDYADSLERRYMTFDSPVRATFQQRILDRMIAAGAAKPSCSMWDYARFELSRTRFARQYPNSDALLNDVLRLVDFRGGRKGDWRIGARRLDHVRTPLLVVATADDPLGSTQATVDLIARVRNPNVGLLVLPRGGHMGLSAADARSYYSMLRAVYDPTCCPTAATLLARR